MQPAKGNRLMGQNSEVSAEADGAAPPYRVTLPDGRDADVGPGATVRIRPGSRSGGRSVRPRVETIRPDATYL
ncbi:hypothetical protein [Streptacidiphilus jiangxiensis]|uniref:Uncharacterized protein n=1 Tax=Streptacidiphilus jiangxiensis TaxID=235985 RepID=A0A1H7HMJ8_STRJI|nr:hypothetical protein [Streptacidiphilus jiangxiensis]SEK49455.1 hypothetical protein SAMN05414137_102206 [Streptacidiphilus jiangxiensis]